MNYINKHVKSINHNDTIGIIITRVENEFVILYSSNERIISTTYILN